MTGNLQLDDRLGDFTADRRILTLTGMAALIGVISAFVALALLRLIGFFTHLFYYHAIDSRLVSPADNRLGVWALLVPIVGGLIVGLMARYGSERIRGHGIPEALEAILIGQSRMSARVAVLKPLSSAIAIGTGGPFGAEGPIIMTGGALGSLFGQAFHLSPAERMTLLVAGAAGGMAAVFGTPLAATLLAVELLLFEWKPRSFIPVACAAAVAGALRVPLLGAGPLFPVPPHAALTAHGLVIALALGIAAGFGSGLLTWLVYACEDLFRKVPVHWMWWPLLGGAVIGLGGLLYPRALGVGYDTIHDLLTGQLVGVALLGLVVTKAVIWAVALGSGTSGGVLAPLLLMGGALGALDAHHVHRRRVHGGADARRQRAAGAAGRVRRRRCRDRAPHEALDPHREGRAPRVSRDPRVHREPPAPLAGARRHGAPGAAGRRSAAGGQLPRRAARSRPDQNARARSRPLAGGRPERARAGRRVRGARRDPGGVGAVRPRRR